VNDEVTGSNEEARILKNEIELISRRYQALFSHTNDGIFISNPEGIHIDVNDRALEMLGYTRDEVVGHHYSEFTDPDESHDSSSVLSKLLAGETLPVYQRGFIRKDGSRIIAENNVAVVRDQEGDILQFHSVIRDISERIELQKRLQDSLAERELLFRELNHRVNNNLNMLQGLIHLELSSSVDSGMRKSLQQIAQRIEALSAMHHNLYKSDDLGRISLRNFLEDLIAGISVLQDNRRVIIEAELEDISIGYQQGLNIALIVNELLTNSIKHAFPAEKADSRIEISSRLEKQQLILEIGDNGRGMPPGINPFRQDSMGFQIIRTLAGQLKADMSIPDIQPGFHAIFAIPATQND
jgi:PAS domain S-box-containing protein